MEQNKVRTYILYAIGEILLVMIGILLALQVNNWNEERIEREQERELLTQIQSDLQATSERITDLQSKLEISIHSADSLLASFRTKEELDSFAFDVSLIHRRFFFRPATSGYTQLGSASGGVIQNDDLRNQIAMLYEDDFQEIAKRQDLLSEHLNQNVAPKSGKYFDLNKRITFRMSNFDENSMDFYSPIDFNEIVKDTEYVNSIVILKRFYTMQVNQLEKSLEKTIEALNLIEMEII